MDTPKTKQLRHEIIVTAAREEAPARPWDGYPESQKPSPRTGRYNSTPGRPRKTGGWIPQQASPLRSRLRIHRRIPALSLCGEPSPAPGLGARRTANCWSRPDRKEPVASAQAAADLSAAVGCQAGPLQERANKPPQTQGTLTIALTSTLTLTQT